MTHQPQTLTRIGDFDPAQSTIYAYCGACGHNAPVDPEKVEQGLEIRTLPARLRCPERGFRDCSVRIVYTGAGEIEYPEG